MQNCKGKQEVNKKNSKKNRKKKQYFSAIRRIRRQKLFICIKQGKLKKSRHNFRTKIFRILWNVQYNWRVNRISLWQENEKMAIFSPNKKNKWSKIREINESIFKFEISAQFFFMEEVRINEKYIETIFRRRVAREKEPKC